MPVDDSPFKRRVRMVFGGVWDHDLAANSKHGSVAWANSWVTAGVNVKLPFLERTVCLLVLFRLRLWTPPPLPWYLTKTTPSFADMLAKVRRVIIASQFHPGRASVHSVPTHREITQVQNAWAAAGL